MKILEISEYYFGFCGILVLNKSRSASIKAFIQNVFVILYTGPFFCETSAAYIYYHPDRLDNSIQAFAGLCAAILIAGKYLCLRLNENRIKMLIAKFQETVDEAPDKIRELYFDAETKARRFTKFAVTIMLIAWISADTLCTLFSAFYNNMHGQLDTREWFHILYMQIPYENQIGGVVGYFLKQFIALVIVYNYVMTVTPSVTFFMNCHDLFEVGVFHIKSLFVEMDELAQQNSESNSQEIKIRMVRVVNLHIRLFELAELLSKITSGPIFFQMMCMIGYIAACLNLVKFEFDLTTIEASVAVLSGVFLLFVYSFFATRISNMLEQIEGIAYQSQWYNYSIQAQKCVIMIIRRAQVPVRFNGLKMFDCNMEVFAAIMRLICTYYVMLQELKEN